MRFVLMLTVPVLLFAYSGTWMITQGMMIMNSDPMSDPSQDRVARTDDILDRVDREEFFIETYIASGHNTVQSVIQQKKGFSFLVANMPISGPLMIQRIEQKRLARTETLIVYFLAFREAGYAPAIPHMVHYIKTLPESDRKAVFSPWHPFGYALMAIEKITGQELDLKQITSLFDQRIGITDRAMNWYQDHFPEGAGKTPN